MGGEGSKQKPPPPKKPRVRKNQQVYDYLPGSARDRPKSSRSWFDVQYVTKLGQQGRSAQIYDAFSSETALNKETPKWQSKWEIDMRPDPTTTEEKVQELRPWRSMPLPTTDNAPAMTNVTASHKPKARKGKRLSKRSEKLITPLPEVDEVDAFERTSLASMQVDGFKMIYKTDAITDNMIYQTSKLWQYEPKKANKQWFLGHQDSLGIIEQKELPPRKSLARKILVQNIID